MLTKRDFGLWSMIRAIRPRSLVWPEGVLAIVLGALVSWGLEQWTSPESRSGLVGDYLVMASVLLGIVFATLALVVSLLSDSYLLFLEDSSSGIRPFMAPFIVGVGVQASALLGALTYRAVASSTDSGEPWLFALATILFVYAVLDIVGLAKTVVAHAVTRARYLAALRDADCSDHQPSGRGV